MDEFLATVGIQAMRYAIRSGIALTSTYAMGQCSRLLKSIDDKDLYSELRSLQRLLDNKIKVISPAIDLIEFKSGRGNVFLESALPLAKSLHQKIVALGRRIEATAVAEEQRHQEGINKKSNGKSSHLILQKIVEDLKTLLREIDKEIPLLQLAISASGESLSTSLPAGISPSRLLQASTLLIIGDTQHAQDPRRSVQIGPSFILSVYMLFRGHASIATNGSSNIHGKKGTSSHTTAKPNERIYGLGENDRKPLWQEAIHKARVRLCRSACHASTENASPNQVNSDTNIHSMGIDYSYHLEIVEDLDDGRVHDDMATSQAYDGIQNAGRHEFIPIYQLEKIFYTDTGKLLNIGDGRDGENNPVLLLKRDISASLLKSTGLDFYRDIHSAIDDKANQTDNEDEQADIDRQILGEFTPENTSTVERESRITPNMTSFPKHLDPEWIAFEVFEEDDHGDNGSETEDGAESSDNDDGLDQLYQQRLPHQRSSLDSSLISQIKNLSFQPDLGKKLHKSQVHHPKFKDSDIMSTVDAQDFVSRSPFGGITTSLSLIEMLIRLAGLQEFQQASHLSIPDHILTFFLEETSTTGQTGEAMWRTRSETKRHVGFDPYTDTT